LHGAAVANADHETFLSELVAEGLLIASGVEGVYGTSAFFEEVRDGIDRAAAALGRDDALERLRFPPVLPRRVVETSGYLGSFPHLLGSVFSFVGNETAAAEQEALASRHEDWSQFQQMSDLVLLPAACYPVYPAIAARGRLLPGGLTVETGGAYVFRNEPSIDPARLQAFHMHEHVRIGEPEAVAFWREAWGSRAVDFLAELGLDVWLRPASDPFFGRTGRMLAASQLQQELKLEVVAPISGDAPTAIASLNYHQDHFASRFDLVTSEGDVAHTACVGFGEERVVLALLRAHGFERDAWPTEVTRRLWSNSRRQRRPGVS
jgi:seryl-tRNA synthetase